MNDPISPQREPHRRVVWQLTLPEQTTVARPTRRMVSTEHDPLPDTPTSVLKSIVADAFTPRPVRPVRDVTVHVTIPDHHRHLSLLQTAKPVIDATVLAGIIADDKTVSELTVRRSNGCATDRIDVVVTTGDGNMYESRPITWVGDMVPPTPRCDYMLGYAGVVAQQACLTMACDAFMSWADWQRSLRNLVGLYRKGRIIHGFGSRLDDATLRSGRLEITCRATYGDIDNVAARVLDLADGSRFSFFHGNVSSPQVAQRFVHALYGQSEYAIDRLIGSVTIRKDATARRLDAKLTIDS